jgi:hypothetical protein
VNDPHARNLGVAAGALFASSSTLICCVLPAMLVSVGAGAALVGLISAVPQLVWLSEHKALVFGLAGAALIGGGILLWRARRLPCPTEPLAAQKCTNLRRASRRLYGMAVVTYGIGAAVAFLLPGWTSSG